MSSEMLDRVCTAETLDQLCDALAEMLSRETAAFEWHTLTLLPNTPTYRLFADLVAARSLRSMVRAEQLQGTAESAPAPVVLLHQYHCPLDGTQLIEVGLGLLECRQCKTQFVPSLSEGLHGEASLSWPEGK
jgi:hypothetical protein